MIAELQSPPVLQPQYGTTVVAEHGNSQIQIAIAVEIPGLYISHTSDIIQNHVLFITISHTLIEFHAPDHAIVGHEITENRNDDIQIAIGINVDGGRMGRCR